MRESKVLSVYACWAGREPCLITYDIGAIQTKRDKISVVIYVPNPPHPPTQG